MTLTPQEQETLNLIEREQPIKRRTVARTLRVREQTAAQYLHTLRQAGLIEPVSAGSGSHWVLAQARRNTVASRAIVQAASVWQYAQRLEAM